jgi:hypothetical protein
VAKGQYNKEALLLILVSVLPNKYQSIVDKLKVQSGLSIDDQIKYLQNKEEYLELGAKEVNKSVYM